MFRAPCWYAPAIHSVSVLKKARGFPMQSLCLLSKCRFRWADFIDSLTNVSWHKTQWGFGASHQSKKPLLQVVEAVFPFRTACRIFLLCLTLSVCPCTGVRLARRARATSTGCGSDIISGNQSHVSTSNDVSRRMLGFRIFCVLSASSSVGFLGSVKFQFSFPHFWFHSPFFLLLSHRSK